MQPMHQVLFPIEPLSPRGKMHQLAEPHHLVTAQLMRRARVNQQTSPGCKEQTMDAGFGPQIKLPASAIDMDSRKRPHSNFHDTDFMAMAIECGAKAFSLPTSLGTEGVCMTVQQLRTFAAMVLMGQADNLPVLTEVIEEEVEADFLPTEVMEYPA